MVGFDDAAMLGLGVANAGVQAYGQRVAQRHAKKAAKLQNAERQAQFADQQQDLDLSRLGTIRESNLAGQDVAANDMERGMSRSTAAQEGQTRVSNERDRRINSIDRAKARLSRGFEAENKVRKVQKRAQKAQQMFDMMGSFLNSGAAGGGASMVAGRKYDGGSE